MKKFHFIVCFSSLLVLFSNIGCKKDVNMAPAPTIPTPPASPNTAPDAHAGDDLFVILPNNNTVLNGSAHDSENNIQSYSWSKVSGPNSYTLENNNDKQTKANNLEKGVYQFELTVTDKMGLYDKDTLMITVGEMAASSREVIFKNLAWSCPLGCSIIIENIYSHIPPGNIFKVFIQEGNATNWEEAIHISGWSDSTLYTYTVYNDNLMIYNNDKNGSTDVKIVY